MKFRKFTLIELLMVCAIIAILTCILLPALSKAKASVHAISCGNNIKQLGSVVFMYASDYNDILPLRKNATSTSTDWAPNSLFPYLNYKIDTSGNKVPTIHCPASRNLATEVYSLGNNYYLSAYKITSIKKTSSTVLYFDCLYQGDYGQRLDTTDEAWVDVSQRHSKKANYGMLDNHVEKLKREDILFPSVSPTSNLNCQKWYPGYQ